MKKLLWRLFLNALGFSLIMAVFGWFLYNPPGRDSLIDLEQACQRLDDVHLRCYDRPDGSREGWSLVYTPEGGRQLDQQCQLARTLYLLPADFQFPAWESNPMQPPPEPPWVMWMCYGVNVTFFALLTWADPIGRMLRSKRKLLIGALLLAPSLAYTPGLYRSFWMHCQISGVVKQNYRLLWNEREGHQGVVVILRQHPAEVEQALRERLQLQDGDRLSVVCITAHDAAELPPHFLALLAVELLLSSWLSRRWLVRLWGLLV